MTSLLKPLAASYVTADIGDGRDLKLDIERIALPDSSYDAIVCNHVLEHVDDQRALAELHRILAHGGVLALMIPVEEGSPTYEDSTITTPQGRLQAFGQSDHLRIYGSDVRDRIRAAQFTINEFLAVEPDVNQYGLLRGDRVFVCRRG